jgi:beta-galactosidase
VCVVIPRSLHRLERLLHAFGPISAAAFDVMGLGAYDSCLEQGPFAARLFEAERFLRSLLEQLSDRGIAYRVSGNDSATHALSQSRFGFVLSAGGLERELWRTLDAAASAGALLHFGPNLPRTSPSGLDPLPDVSSTAAANLRAVSELELPSELSRLCDAHAPLRLLAGAGVRSSLFRDRDGAPRVLFVTNTTRAPVVAKLEAAALGDGIASAVDALDGDTFRATFGSLEVPLSPQSVRMLELLR